MLHEAETGSPVALSALDHVGHWLGIGLAGLVNIFNPELIVLGGLFGRIHPFVGPGVEHELDRRALSAPRRLVRVVPAMLGVDAPLLGAAELAFDPLIADPAGWLVPRGRQLELASARPTGRETVRRRSADRSGSPRASGPLRAKERVVA